MAPGDLQRRGEAGGQDEGVLMAPGVLQREGEAGEQDDGVAGGQENRHED